MSEIIEKLRRLDAYPKTPEDFNIKTFGGAAITIVSVVIMAMLFWIEFMNYLTPNITEELFVDTSRSPNIKINLDIVVSRVSCDFLALDAMDSSGEQHLQLDHYIYKRRLGLDGIPLEEAVKVDITSKDKEVAVINKTECGSCYGAALDPNRCCNTCEEVREAYRERQWAFPPNPENISQCRDEHFNEKLETAFKQGCQIYGSLLVNRVSGSFHIAPGKSFTINHVHVHDVQPFPSTAFNTSHKIRNLSFGTMIDSESHNPLRNTHVVATEGKFRFLNKLALIILLRNFIKTNRYSVLLL
ncbi:endoplasmic reticulum-golgi intermediate compartment protein [Holotrichia oblita]|uniref:Endoplasmic reticulum-golgi intermediate compartment protein n=1 Tax=Holotrichia oblita TaxID=644536 RepID=A0ACB9TFZ7_HOLOL|nr:endoplasmic reticulum-golgi intermediate compartment protein [Holotrichia oblita]